MSNEKIEDCNHVVLDSHSRTSAILTRILLKEYWDTNPRYSTVNIDEIEELESEEAVLMIGDKVFENEKKYKYSYDLGYYWKKLTGLPFAYAVWIAKGHVSQGAIDQLSIDLNNGINSIDQVIEEQRIKEPLHDLESYYRDNIDYVLDTEKRKALDLYLTKMSELELVHD
jgi:chorismate dehydratase